MEKVNEVSLTKEQIEDYSEKYRLVRHAVEELVRAGIPVGDANEEIPIGDYVINLLVAYAKQRHMPLTTHITMKLFIDLANGWALTPLTLGDEEFSDNGIGTGIEFNTRDKRILRWKKTGEVFNQEAYMCKIWLLKDLGSDKVHTAPENMMPQFGPLYLHKDGIATGRYLALHSCIIDKTGNYKVPDPIVINVIGIEYEKGQHVLFCDEDSVPFKSLSEEYDVRIEDRPKLKDKSIYDVTFEDLFSANDEKDRDVQGADA